jgi:hypothetical protein
MWLFMLSLSDAGGLPDVSVDSLWHVIAPEHSVTVVLFAIVL